MISHDKGKDPAVPGDMTADTRLLTLGVWHFSQEAVTGYIFALDIRPNKTKESDRIFGCTYITL